MIRAVFNEQPDMVPVSPDISNMIPCKLTGKPFWDIHLYQDPPLRQAYIEAVRYFGFDGWLPHVPVEFPHEAAERLGGPGWTEAIIARTPERIYTRLHYSDGEQEHWTDCCNVCCVADPPTHWVTLSKVGLSGDPPTDWEDVEPTTRFEGLDAEVLGGLKTLVIPNSEVFGPVDATLLDNLVRNDGGILVVTGNSGARLPEANSFDTNRTPAINVAIYKPSWWMDYPDQHLAAYGISPDGPVVLPDPVVVDLHIVSAAFEDCFCVESPDRVRGLRVAWTGGRVSRDRLVTAAGPLTARSNPMVVGAKPPTYGVYWGDIHGHTQLSDGLGKDADYYYDYAREAADLDVCATAEHAYHEEARVASRKHNRPGEFVTIWGFEWSENLPGRLDRNIYFRNEEVAIPKGWPKVTEDWWKMLDQHYGDNKNHDVIVGPHMFTYKTASKPWYETWNPAFERFAEIYSEHGMSEFKGNPRMLAGGDVQDGFFAQDGLKYGPRFGFIGSSDTHDSHPGRGSNSLVNRGGLVAFLAKDLTRESIWDAFWSRRVYAATTERIFIDFRIDGHVMGEEFSTTGKPKISYTIHGCDDRFEVSVIKNNQVLRGTKTTSGSANESFVDDSFTDSSCYYLRVAQDNGEWAWSSPIWVDRVR